MSLGQRSRANSRSPTHTSSTNREPGGGHEHQFLALFAGDSDDVAPPICRMHVVLGPTSGWGLTRMVQRVYLVNRTTDPPLPIEGLTWSVTLDDQPSPASAERRARLEPVLPPPEPRLCRVAGSPGRTRADGATEAPVES